MTLLVADDLYMSKFTSFQFGGVTPNTFIVFNNGITEVYRKNIPEGKDIRGIASGIRKTIAMEASVGATAVIINMNNLLG